MAKWIPALLTLALAAPAMAEDPFLRRTATVQAVEKAGPAVVNITTERVVARASPFRTFQTDPFFDRHKFWTDDYWDEIFQKEFPTFTRGFIGAVEEEE